VTTIEEYHQSIKARLIIDPLVRRFEVRRERRNISDGHLRARLTLSNGSQLEFSEYVRLVEGQVQVFNYSFHWADSDGKLIKRWDNVPHFMQLPQAPHHIHDGKESNVVPGAAMSITKVLDEISLRLSGQNNA
jgi:hypothetical protein